MPIGSYLFIFLSFATLLNFVGIKFSPTKTPTKDKYTPFGYVLDLNQEKNSVQETSFSPIYHNGGRFAAISTPSKPGPSIENLIDSVTSILITPQQGTVNSTISAVNPTTTISAVNPTTSAVNPTTSAVNPTTSAVRPSLNFKRSLLNYRLATARAVTGYKVVQVRGFAVFSSIRVTNQDLLLTPPARIPRLEKHVDTFVQILHHDSRLQALTKTVNIQNWDESAANEPIIIFNADATYGLYRTNRTMISAVKKHILHFLKENPKLQFSLQLRESDADHVQEHNMIQAFGLGKKDTATYLLRPDAHTAKTHGLSLAQPDNITSIPEWYLNNCAKTIDFLEKLWIDGKLTNTVECFDQYSEAITECTNMDIAIFNQTELSSVGLLHHSTITVARQSIDDSLRLGRLIGYTEPPDMMVEAALGYARTYAEKAKSTSALLHQGELLANKSSAAVSITSQAFDKETFKNCFKTTIRTAQELLPILLNDTQFQANVQDVLDILDGGGSYAKHLNSVVYQEILETLRDPKRKFNLVPVNAIVSKSISKKT